MRGHRVATRFVVPTRLAGVALLGLFAAFALGSCGGDGEAIGTGALSVSLTGASLPARTAPAVTETTTLTETAPAATETVTVTETVAAPAETVPAETETETVTVTETVPAETTAPAVETVATTVTVTTTEGVNPAAAAAAGAAAASEDGGLTSTEWGWVAFAILAAAVGVGGIVWWVRKRSARGEAGA
jgi:hypothetical protein